MSMFAMQVGIISAIILSLSLYQNGIKGNFQA